MQRKPNTISILKNIMHISDEDRQTTADQESGLTKEERNQISCARSLYMLRIAGDYYA